jgi:hypothetical protein
MKSTSPAVTRSKMLFSFFLILAASGFVRCHAQAIIGKWEAVSTKSYLTPEAAKEMGSAVIVTTSGPEAGTGTNIFRSDNTYTMSVTPGGSQDAIVMKGKWTLSGDQLKIIMDSPGNPTTTITVSFSGNNMVMSNKMPAPSKTTKVETTYRKVN